MSSQIGFGYSCGMNTTDKEACKQAEYLSDNYFNGRNVDVTCHATHGIFWDLAECGLGRCGFAINSTRLNHQKWDNHFDKYPDSYYFEMAYSQGAIHVSNALETYPRRDKILALGLSPGKIISRKLCYEAGNIANTGDCVYATDSLGRWFNRDAILYVNPSPGGPLIRHSFYDPDVHKEIRPMINEMLTTIPHIKW